MMTRAQRRRDQFFIECAQEAGLKERSRELWAGRLQELVDREAKLVVLPQLSLAAAVKIENLKAAV